LGWLYLDVGEGGHELSRAQFDAIRRVGFSGIRYQLGARWTEDQLAAVVNAAMVHNDLKVIVALGASVLQQVGDALVPTSAGIVQQCARLIGFIARKGLTRQWVVLEVGCEPGPWESSHYLHSWLLAAHVMVALHAIRSSDLGGDLRLLSYGPPRPGRAAALYVADFLRWMPDQRNGLIVGCRCQSSGERIGTSLEHRDRDVLGVARATAGRPFACSMAGVCAGTLTTARRGLKELLRGSPPTEHQGGTILADEARLWRQRGAEFFVVHRYRSAGGSCYDLFEPDGLTPKARVLAFKWLPPPSPSVV